MTADERVKVLNARWFTSTTGKFIYVGAAPTRARQAATPGQVSIHWTNCTTTPFGSVTWK